MDKIGWWLPVRGIFVQLGRKDADLFQVLWGQGFIEEADGEPAEEDTSAWRWHSWRPGDDQR